MFAEITSIYEIHRWARYTMWTTLLIMVLLLTWLSGGLPLLAWRQLPSTLLQLPRACTLNCLGAMFSLLGGLLLSLGWLLAWCLLLGASLGLLRHHWRWQRREREMAALLSTNGTVPLLRPSRHKESRPPGKIISMPLAGPMEHAMSNRQKTYRSDDDGEHEEDRTEYTAPVPLLRLPQQLRQTPRSFHLLPQQGNIDSTPSTSSPNPRLSSTLTTRPTSRLARALEVGVGWHAGKVRRGAPNEDSLLALQGIYTSKDRLLPFGLFIVADGMGGHAYGREASQLAIQIVTHAVMRDIIGGEASDKDPDDAWFISVLMRGVEQANQAICAFSEKVGQGKGMGTTITAALVLDATAYVVNVGDSRTYLYREGEGLSQITKDHSLVARLVETEQIEPDDVYTHPQRNQIYRSVGNPGGIDVDWFLVSVQRGDRLLLCSDGLWEMVRDPAIEQMVGRKVTVAAISEHLVRAALEGGGADNISVVVAEVV